MPAALMVRSPGWDEPSGVPDRKRERERGDEEGREETAASSPARVRYPACKRNGKSEEDIGRLVFLMVRVRRTLDA
jgi:hypothetical protein